MKKYEMREKVLGAILILFFLFAGASMSKAAESGLSERQEAIIPIAAFTAEGNESRLSQAIENGLDKGLTINEIKEILIQMYAYTGFPRSLTGLSTFMKVLDARQKAGKKDIQGPEPLKIPPTADKNALGTATQTKLAGKPVAGPLFEFAPGIDAFLKEHLFCDIFGRGILTDQERELATIGALAALPAPAQLESHLNICRNVGLTGPQMAQYIQVLANKVGQKEAELATPLVKKVFGN